MTLKIQIHSPTYLNVTDQKCKKSIKLYFLLRFVFSVDIAFIKFAPGVSANRTSWFLVGNVFLLLKRCAFWKEDSRTNSIPALESGPRNLASYLFPKQFKFKFTFKRRVTKFKKKKKTTHKKMSNWTWNI